MIRTIVIDDDPEIRAFNKALLNMFFDEIDVLGEAGTVQDGIKLIQDVKPQLVLLDIELTDGNGFQILQKVKPYDFSLIFITAYNEFAVKAIKFSALDYILKPIDEMEFKASVNRAINGIEKFNRTRQVDNFIDIYERKTQHRKIALRTAESVSLVEVKDILFCQSERNYTTVYMSDGNRVLTSRVLKEYDELLSPYDFVRPHQSYLVNLNHILRIDKSEGGSILLQNQTSIPISSRRKNSLMQILDKSPHL